MATRPVLISIAVHGAIIAAIVWTTSGRAPMQQQDLGLIYDRPPDSAGMYGGIGGLAVRRPAPPPGRSLSPEEAKDYIGRYSVANPGRPNVEMRISHVHDGKEHWSLMVDEGNRYPYMIIPVARDSFVYQLPPERSIVFVRRDTAVVAIELHSGDEIRRGVKVLNR